MGFDAWLAAASRCLGAAGCTRDKVRYSTYQGCLQPIRQAARNLWLLDRELSSSRPHGRCQEDLGRCASQAPLALTWNHTVTCLQQSCCVQVFLVHCKQPVQN